MPVGWSAVRSDFRHFCEVHGAGDFRARLRVLCRSRALWALAIYRFGRWVHARRRFVLWRAFYAAAFTLGRFLTKTSLSVHARIESQVWIAPRGQVFVSRGTRLGRGSMLHGDNTLGVGGRAGSRGHPRLGEGVVMAPGASAVGPAQIPAGSVIGANTLVGRSLPHGGCWLGVPPRPTSAERARIPKPQQMHTSPEQQMEPEPFWPAFRADLDRHLVYHPGAGFLRKLRVALASEGVWAMAVHRFGRSLRGRKRPFSRLLHGILQLALGVATSISIDTEAVIEPGFYIGHFVSLRIGPGVRIGRNSSVSQMCTIEGTGPSPERSAPVLGERVYLGSGSRVIGPVKIGDGAAVCANSVVVEDVPANGVVLGNPGVVVSRRGSVDFIYLGGESGVRDLPPAEEQAA